MLPWDHSHFEQYRRYTTGEFHVDVRGRRKRYLRMSMRF